MRRGESAPRKMVFDIIKPNRKAKPKHPKQPFVTYYILLY
ncbi:unnamed protein product [Callosobruchus maculatus]|uniref:Uncharacterized protein n=1 Tax=Callosobruchus maculatus TaxID=64391 RepID=A0A653DYL7_CALMS|nr:unnamed protein product [Callosobruchus maculatus]